MSVKLYSVKFVKSARKEFLKLPVKVQNKIVEALSFLSENPFSELLQIKKLKGIEDLYRVRIGDYRLVYSINNFELMVIVIKVGHRRDIYKKL